MTKIVIKLNTDSPYLESFLKALFLVIRKYRSKKVVTDIIVTDTSK